MCMEDNSGKVWAFKYTFWRSYQDYVLTREWSQFVKEKRLSVGDVISFLRSRTNLRLYIDFKLKTKSSVEAIEPTLEAIEKCHTVKLFGVNYLSTLTRGERNVLK
ncbi:hypothetical protein ACSBR2_041618 [Camellia fascicularis]